MSRNIEQARDAEPISSPDPRMPTYTVDQAVALCHQWGLDFVTPRTIQTAISNRVLRRHLIANKLRLSENALRNWINSTADAEYIGRRADNGGAA